MNEELDTKYRLEALRMLNHLLPDCPEKYSGSKNIEISKSELLDYYSKAQLVLQSNSSDQQTYNIANSVFETCIRLVRVSCMENEAKSIYINGDFLEPPEERLVDVIISESRHLLEKEC